MSDPAEAFRHLCIAVAWLTEATHQTIGTDTAQAILDKLTEALDAAGVERADDE